jgi:NAD(P)H-hydrate epimerase
MDPVLSRAQVRRIDELAMSRYGIPTLVLMENAGSNAARIVRCEYPASRRVLIACGIGNNGGDGLVMARHFHNFGWDVQLLVAGSRERMTDAARTHLNICTRMRLPVFAYPGDEKEVSPIERLSLEDLIVDALLGTGFTGLVRTPISELIEELNSSSRRAMIAVDIPSGLDCDTGRPTNATIRADMTVTFAGQKLGFDQPGASAFTGRVIVADIGVPRELLLTDSAVGAQE